MRDPADHGLPATLAARDGEEVEVHGRYEATHQGRYRVMGPDGPTPWLATVHLDDGGTLRLGGRAEAERLAMLGRDVTARGRLIVAPARPAPHVAAMEPAPTLGDAVITPRGEVPLYDTVPPGLVGPRTIVEVVTTHLQMVQAPTAELAAAPAGVRVVHAAPPGVRFYRFLYDAVGAPWHWYDRKRWSDAELAAVVDDPRVEVHVAWRHGTPVGYVELDRRIAGGCEVAYFGLVPEAVGHGLGTWFLRWAVHHAWRDPALTRLWVHTCTLDHASARAVYEKVGFHAHAHERHRQYIVAGAPDDSR